MKKTSAIIAGFAVFLPLFLTTPPAWGADCLAIRKQIEQEKDLLARKELTQQGISDCPNDPIINFEYAYTMERLRKYKMALSHYQIAAKLAPKYSKSYFGIGDMYMNLEEPGEAVKAYQAGLSLEPDNKRAQLYLEEAKNAAKEKGGNAAGIAAFVNPLAPVIKPVQEPPKTAQISTTPAIPAPYAPAKGHIMQNPEPMPPVVGTPLQSETMQTMNFDKAGHTDITGSLEDNRMGAE